MSFQVSDFTYLINGPYCLTIEKGQSCGLFGPSGIGKSQFCRALTELILSEGRVALDGAVRESFAGPEWRSRVAYLPAESSWWYDVVGEHFSSRIDSEVLANQCEVLGLSREVGNWQVDRLSTGERQRLALLRGIMGGPQVLLLDEPTSSLGEEHVRCVEKFIREYRLRQKCSVLWISHDLAQLSRVADICFRMTRSALEELQLGTGEACGK